MSYVVVCFHFVLNYGVVVQIWWINARKRDCVCQTSLTLVCGAGVAGAAGAHSWKRLITLPSYKIVVAEFEVWTVHVRSVQNDAFSFWIPPQLCVVDVVSVAFFVLLQLRSGGSNRVCYYKEEGCVRSAFHLVSAAGVTFKNRWIT